MRKELSNYFASKAPKPFIKFPLYVDLLNVHRQFDCMLWIFPQKLVPLFCYFILNLFVEK